MINIIKSIKLKEFETSVLLLKNSIVSQHLQSANIPYIVAPNLFYRFIYKYYNHTVTNFTKWYRPFKIIHLSICWILSRYIFAPLVLKNLQFDIVHLNSSVLTDWLAPCKAKGKVVLHIQEPFSNGHFGIRSQFFRHQMQKYADRIITISYDNYYRINIPEKTHVIYNFSNHQNEKPEISSYENKKVLFVGGASYIKGFHLMTAALEYVNDDIEVFFLGRFPSTNSQFSIKHFIKMLILPRYRIQIQSLKKMRSSIIAHEIGLEKEIYNYLDIACCLVSPFIIPHFSRPIIEAFSYSKPVIATNIQGTDEIVFHGRNGILVAPHPKELANAINFLSSQPEYCKNMGENAYRIACKEFSVSNIGMYTQIYETIIKPNS